MPRPSSQLYALCVFKTTLSGRKSFYRISRACWHKQTAVRVFQSALLFGSTNGTPLELRPVRVSEEASLAPSYDGWDTLIQIVSHDREIGKPADDSLEGASV